MSIKTWFVGLWTTARGAVAKFFEGPGGVVVRDALGTAIHTAGAIGISLLLDVARQKVVQLEPVVGTGEFKREQALNYLKGFATQQGIQVSESVLRYILETAVQAVRGNK